MEPTTMMLDYLFFLGGGVGGERAKASEPRGLALSFFIFGREGGQLLMEPTTTTATATATTTTTIKTLP